MSKALERSRKTPTVVSRWSIAEEILLSHELEHGTLNSFFEIQTGSGIVYYIARRIRSYAVRVYQSLLVARVTFESLIKFESGSKFFFFFDYTNDVKAVTRNINFPVGDIFHSRSKDPLPLRVSGCVAPSPCRPKLRRPNLSYVAPTSKLCRPNDLLHENSLMENSLMNDL